MKTIADTSVWIEFLKGNKDIFNIFRKKLENQEIVAVEYVFAELLQGVKDTREKEIIQDYWGNLPKLNETGIWIKAGIYSNTNSFFNRGIGLIDGVLLVLSKEYNLKIWTLDKKLLSVLDDMVIF